MNLDGVDVFVKVVQVGGFSAAARQLGMPTTTVSAKIARLEDRLGVTLIHRSTRRMHVTPAGEAYYRRCVEAVNLLATGESELAAVQARPSGLLRITAAPDIAQLLLPAIVAAYLERYPETRIDLRVTNDVLDLIRDGIDLAVRAALKLSDSSYLTRTFSAGTLVLKATPGFLAQNGQPASIADVDPALLLVHPRFPAALEFRGPDGSSHTLRAAGRASADDLQTLRALARNGLGMVLLPDLGPVDDGFVNVFPGYSTLPAPLHFVYPASRQTAPTVRAFIDLAVELMGDR